MSEKTNKLKTILQFIMDLLGFLLGGKNQG